MKSFRKVNGGQNSSVWRSFLLEAVPNNWDRRRTWSIWNLVATVKLSTPALSWLKVTHNCQEDWGRWLICSWCSRVVLWGCELCPFFILGLCDIQIMFSNQIMTDRINVVVKFSILSEYHSGSAVYPLWQKTCKQNRLVCLPTWPRCIPKRFYR